VVVVVVEVVSAGEGQVSGTPSITAFRAAVHQALWLPMQAIPSVPEALGANSLGATIEH
jgi:hypothetical protein